MVNNDALDALIGRRAGLVLVHLVAPHTGELGFGSERTHSSRSAAFFSHCFDASSLSFGNEALNSDLSICGSLNSGLLVDGKLLFLQLNYSF